MVHEARHPYARLEISIGRLEAGEHEIFAAIGGHAVSAMFGGSIAGVFDRYRRPKLSAETVRKHFNLKP